MTGLMPVNLAAGYKACESCGRKMRKQATWICRRCMLDARKSWTPELAARRPMAKVRDLACNDCRHFRLCGYRLLLDPAAWVLCEIPDALDLNSASVEAVGEFERWMKNGQKSKRLSRPLKRGS